MCKKIIAFRREAKEELITIDGRTLSNKANTNKFYSLLHLKAKTRVSDYVYIYQKRKINP